MAVRERPRARFGSDRRKLVESHFSCAMLKKLTPCTTTCCDTLIPSRVMSFSVNSQVWPVPCGTLSLKEVVDPLTRRDHMHHEDARGVSALLLRLDGPGRRYVTERGKVTG